MTRHERERNTHGQGWPADRFEANRGRLGPSARQVGPGNHLHVHWWQNHAGRERCRSGPPSSTRDRRAV